MTTLQARVKKLFDEGNEVVQDFIYYQTLREFVGLDQDGNDYANKEIKKLNEKYGGIPKLLEKYKETINVNA